MNGQGTPETSWPGLVAAQCEAPAARLPGWKALAVQTVPGWITDSIRTLMRMTGGLRVFLGDYVGYLKHAGVLHQDEEGRLRARITASFHIIEKGLAHRNPRPGFGTEAAVGLAKSLQAYQRAGYPTSCSQYQSGVAVLDCYREFHRCGHSALPPAIDRFFEEPAAPRITAHREWHVTRSGEDLLASWRGDFRSLAMHRHSIRHFTATPVSDAAIERAVDLARRAPSACNRQPVRVHVLRSRQQIEPVLKLQGGARGFTEEINALLIITADLRAYATFAERNLAALDGGLFAMTLMYALCYEGIGSCPLHLALSGATQKEIRGVAGLDQSEALIVMLGIGNVPESLRTAHSERKPLSEYLVRHESDAATVRG